MRANFETFQRKPAIFFNETKYRETFDKFSKALLFQYFQNFDISCEHLSENSNNSRRFMKFRRMLRIFEACFKVLKSAAKFSRLYKVQINALHKQFHLRQ